MNKLYNLVFTMIHRRICLTSPGNFRFEMKTLMLVPVLLFIYSEVYPQSAADYYAMSQAKFKQGKALDAMVLIEKAIELDSTDFWLYLHKAEIEVSLKQIEEALQDMKHASKIKPKESEPYNRMGILYHSIGEKDSALFNYNVAIKFARTDTMINNYLVNRAAAYLGFMDWKPAIADLEQVLKFAPDDIAALNNISTAYKKTNQTGKAIQSLERIIVIDSTFMGPYVNLGMIYTSSGDYEKAMVYFNKALTIDGREPLTLNNRGFLWYKMKNYDRALVDINQSIELYNTNSYAYKNRALVYFAMEKNSEGCKDLEAASYFDYKLNYGNEVDDLTKQYCK